MALLYTPSSPLTSRTFHFLHTINTKYSTSFSSYAELYAWSTDRIDLFWSSVWDETGIIGQKGSHVVDTDAKPAENPTWFTEARLNWAENMLQSRSPDKIALVQASVYLSHLNLNVVRPLNASAPFQLNLLLIFLPRL